MLQFVEGSSTDLSDKQIDNLLQCLPRCARQSLHCLPVLLKACADGSIEVQLIVACRS